MLTLARIVRIAAALVVGVIFAGIVLHIVGANSRNGIVSFIYDVDGTIVSPFGNVFKPHGFKERIVANWGLAAVVYGIAGLIVAALIARLATLGPGAPSGRGGFTRRRRRRATAV